MTASDPEQGTAPDGSGQWRRVHPVTPLVRSWLAVLAVVFVIGRDWFEAQLGGNRPQLPAGAAGGLPLALAGITLLILVAGGVFFLSWYFTRYQVTAQHVKVNSGVVFRQSRQARLDRVQAIDINQPLLARLFGLAELKFEVADAGESAVRLAYLRLDEARRLRAAILARAAGVAPDPEHPEEAAEAPEHPILELSAGRVVGAALLSGPTLALIPLVTAGIMVIAVFDEPGVAATVAAVFFPAVLAAGAAYWSTFSSTYNFRAAVSPDGIRLRYGLLDTRAQTVPPGRVQAVSVVQPPLWRFTGWYRMQVNVAGYGISTENVSRTTLLPAGTRAEVMQLMAIVLPNPGTDRPFEVFDAGLGGRGSDGGFVTSPRSVRWLSPLTWRRNGFAVTDTALLIRSGALWRALAVVPHERVQSMALHQGPLARRLGAADLVIHSTPGPVTPRLIQAAAGTALSLFHDEAARAAVARRRTLPEQWLTARPDRDGNDEGTKPEGGTDGT